jgi:hypothetical protein
MREAPAASYAAYCNSGGQYDFELQPVSGIVKHSHGVVIPESALHHPR